VTVFVDPEDPARAALDARPGFALSAAALAIHGALGAALWRGWARGPRPARPGAGAGSTGAGGR
jgi:hypothetical protein